MKKGSYISRKNITLFLLFLLLAPTLAQELSSPQGKEGREGGLCFGDTIRIKIVGMSDLHGNFLTYDFIRKRPAIGGLPYVSQFVAKERKDTTQHVILVNAGDVLQGSTQTYHYNYSDKRDEYMPAVFFNNAGVDVNVVGNHDMEVGMHQLLRFMKELNSDLLGANIVLKGSVEPFFKPYSILERGGVRVAVLGLTIPIQSECITIQIAEGLEVINMLESARYWMSHIQANESPDLIVGLFHAGFPHGADTSLIGEYCFYDNSPLYIAQNVPGFDAIVLGHLHLIVTHQTVNINGDSVWLIEPGFGGRNVAVLDFELLKTPNEKAKILRTSARVENVFESQRSLQPEIFNQIAAESDLIERISNEHVAFSLDTICNVKAFFGSAFFVDLVHKVQLDYTKAEISFASPLSTNVVIPPGSIIFSDLFRIYRFENTMTVLSMTGKEIKDYLEYSYNMWINQMQSPRCRLLRTKYVPSGSGRFLGRQFEIPQYYFDSAAGLDYEIDVRKPLGERVRILRMWNGEPFREDKKYSVVTNTYRASGAGGHMDLGAGISRGEIPYRIVSNSNTMIRELIHQKFTDQGEVEMFHFDNWKFVPDSYVQPAKARELYELQGL